ncbi:MAG TPA: sugar phosphate isomerase/epimerase family protein [Phycisphaerales bacterium]|nr:sugar phosphate isomerase/epimerase family protein [Phycisphaerales bacterium]
MHDIPVTRREFTTIAIGAAMAPLLCTAAAGIVKPTRLLKAGKLDMVHGNAPLIEKFALLNRLGYDGVEISSPNNLDPEEVIAARDATGLVIHGTVCSTHWNQPLSHVDSEVRAKGREGIETAIRDCHRYGGDTVLVVPGIVNKSVSYAACYERSHRELRKVLPLAVELNVRLAIENVWNNFLLSPLEAARYVDEFESSHVGWYFDVGNIVNYGWPEHWIRTLGTRTFKIDVKEFSRRKRDDEGLWKGFHVEIGEGDCDWPAVMRALQEVGFKGWATAEVGGGDEHRLRDISERMDRVLSFEQESRQP